MSHHEGAPDYATITLTEERDRARTTAVRLEQELACTEENQARREAQLNNTLAAELEAHGVSISGLVIPEELRDQASLDFTHTCRDCFGTVTIVGGQPEPHDCDSALGQYIDESTDEIAWEAKVGRARAHRKHGPSGIEAIPEHDPRWLSILVEEVDEAAHELTYDSAASLRAELIDILTVTIAWVAALDREASND